MNNSNEKSPREKLYQVWFHMISRCTNTKNRQYKNYGERGISVCKEWSESFLSFYTWALENGYSKELSIDRINVNGNYCPENCRFVTQKEQCLNKRDTIFVHFHNTKIPLKLIVERFGLTYCEVFDFLVKQEQLRK